MSAKFIKIFFLLFLFSCATPPKKLKKPFYYKVQDKDKIFYILGTMHAGFSLESLPEYVLTDINSSEVVAVESTPEQGEELKKLIKDDTIAYFNKALDYNKHLDKDLSPVAWRRLSYTLDQDEVKEYLKSVGAHYDKEHLHPAMVTLMTFHFAKKNSTYLFHPEILAQPYKKYSLMSIAEEKSSVMDAEITEIARDQKKNVISLDTLELTHKAVQSYLGDPGLNYIEIFYGLNSDFGNELDKLKGLQKAYQSGEEQQMISNLDSVKKYEGPLLIERNKHWFKLLRGRKEKVIFVGAGALHLVGPNSLLKMFADNGAIVTRQN